MLKTPLCIAVITPEALKAAESDLQGHLAKALRLCPVLEIRYDLFADLKIWSELCARVFRIHTQAIVLGTIRLKSDGGAFDDTQTHQRMDLWNLILNQAVKPQWIDVEWSVLDAWKAWISEQMRDGIKVLASAHDFKGIPEKNVLHNAVRKTLEARVQGFKIAAMSLQNGDTEDLYELSSMWSNSFEWFAAFAMGQSGQASRLYSLTCGSNLVYVALGKAVAPGQISVQCMLQCLKQVSLLKSEADARDHLTRNMEN